jgi:hypothetical protein
MHGLLWLTMTPHSVAAVKGASPGVIKACLAMRMQCRTSLIERPLVMEMAAERAAGSASTPSGDFHRLLAGMGPDRLFNPPQLWKKAGWGVENPGFLWKTPIAKDW